MQKLYQNSKILWGLLIIWLGLIYLPSVKVIDISSSNGSIPVSWCYLFSVVFIPFLLLQGPSLRIPPWHITGLYVFVIVWAAICIPSYGLSKGILHWLFGAFLLLVLVNAGKYLTKNDFTNILQSGIIVFILCHLLYNAFHWQRLYAVVVHGESASTLVSLTRGGRNLDATWLGLGCFLIKNKKVRIVCLLYSFSYAFIGVSRVGLIASGICLLWILIYDDQYGFRKKTALVWCAIAIIGCGIAFALGLAQRMISRIFLGTGEGATSFLAGREMMWANIGVMFKTNPFGVGAGNALPIMRSTFGFTSYEDVMHNVFFQLLLDEGFIGALWFLGLVAQFLYSQRNRHNGWFREPLAAFLLTYLVLSLVQFHGGEALMIFPLGCYLVSKDASVQVHWPWQKVSTEGSDAKE